MTKGEFVGVGVIVGVSVGVGVVDGVAVFVGVAVSVGDVVTVLVIVAVGRSGVKVEDIASTDGIGEEICKPLHDERNTTIKRRAGKTGAEVILGI